MEQWKPVPSFEGKYEVSSYGRVRRTDGRMLKLHKRSNYLFIAFHDGKRCWSVDVHRLVAELFCGGKSAERNEVNHKNLNKLDNRADNLEWVSHLENVRHAFENGACEGHVSQRSKKELYCKELDRTFPSSYEAASFLNAEYFGGAKQVGTMARNIRWRALGNCNRRAYGFTWFDVDLEPSTTIPKGSTPKRVEIGNPS